MDTGGKLNVHKTFGRRPLNVLCTFNLRPVSTGSSKEFLDTVRSVFCSEENLKERTVKKVQFIENYDHHPQT